jgi:hypothetical protein
VSKEWKRGRRETVFLTPVLYPLGWHQCTLNLSKSPLHTTFTLEATIGKPTPYGWPHSLLTWNFVHMYSYVRWHTKFRSDLILGLATRGPKHQCYCSLWNVSRFSSLVL